MSRAKRAKVIAHRTLADGRRFVCVVCCVCDRRHWLPDRPDGRCPRKPGQFTMGGK